MIKTASKGKEGRSGRGCVTRGSVLQVDEKEINYQESVSLDKEQREKISYKGGRCNEGGSGKEKEEPKMKEEKNMSKRNLISPQNHISVQYTTHTTSPIQPPPSPQHL